MLQSKVDHLVVAARTLGEGVAWCRETLGIEPAAGGEHPLMGTHNRVFAIGSPAIGQAYFEVIAINPEAQAPGRARWFDLDDPQLQAAIAAQPRLIHFVASTNDAPGALAGLAQLGIDRGRLIEAERPTPAGLLRWKISVRDDGSRLYDGTLPTLIQWASRHPAESMAPSGVTLRSLTATHPSAQSLREAYTAIGLEHVHVLKGPACLVAELETPKGCVLLRSQS
jgi:hypothetical protein